MPRRFAYASKNCGASKWSLVNGQSPIAHSLLPMVKKGVERYAKEKKEEENTRNPVTSYRELQVKNPARRAGLIDCIGRQNFNLHVKRSVLRPPASTLPTRQGLRQAYDSVKRLVLRLNYQNIRFAPSIYPCVTSGASLL